MRRTLIGTALTLLAGAAQAQVNGPYGNPAPGALASDCANTGTTAGWCPNLGAGDDAFMTCDGSNGNIIFHSNGQLDCWIYTGGNPGTGGYFEVPNNQDMMPYPSSNQKHCIGFVSLAQTAVQYTAGYPVADWPNGTQIWQDQETGSGSNQNAFEHFGWISTFGTSLPAYSTLAYHVFCPIQ